MGRRIHTAGWGLLTVAVIALAAVIITGAFRAHGDAAFNRWVGWATIAAVPIAALGVVFILWDKIVASVSTPEPSMHETEDELAAVVLAQAQVTRSRLIGANQPDDGSANIRFAKCKGRFREVGGAIGGDLSSVLHYYESLSPRRLAVLGEPGSGKTVLVLELQIRLLQARQRDVNIPIPVLVSAASYDPGSGWADWFAQHLAQRFAISSDRAVQLVRDGRVLPLVDGIDEMDPVGEPERAGALIEVLNTWMSGLEKAPVVVTCRHGEYRALARGLDRATHIELLPLIGTQAADYLQDQFLDANEQRRWHRVLATLRAEPDGALARELANPWRLTLALAAFRGGDDPSALLPGSASLAGAADNAGYGRRIDCLLLDGYVPAVIRKHSQPGGYEPRDVRRWLTALADGLAWQACHGRSSTDIRLDQWWEATGRWSVRLTHIAVAALPSVLMTILGAATGNLWLIDVAAAVFFLQVPLAARQPGPPSRLRLRRLKTSLGIINLAVAIVLGGPVVGLILWLLNLHATGVAVWVVVAVVFGLASGLISGMTERSPRTISPLDLIRADGRYGLVRGAAFGLTAGFVIAVTLKVKFGIATGIDISLTAALAGYPSRLASTWTRYHASALVNAVRRGGPLRFAAFLDWACQAGLLRVSGVAYQFRHRQLQDWLTSPGRRL